mmetsp:Transcript_55098/g.91469  ORF Transcript_55098/g.91469 Transcript_55098/m.91469 type:complete len:141 (+) Transcript_55098:365-787(+)
MWCPTHGNNHATKKTTAADLTADLAVVVALEEVAAAMEIEAAMATAAEEDSVAAAEDLAAAVMNVVDAAEVVDLAVAATEADTENLEEATVVDLAVEEEEDSVIEEEDLVIEAEDVDEDLAAEEEAADMINLPYHRTEHW